MVRRKWRQWVLALGAGVGAGLVLTWALVLRLFPLLEPTTVGFDAPHMEFRLKLHY
ncbi:hypothetical protein [Mycolicibacterium sp.]|uniref:hypothetical protein n=1 Tax=Mycolicibacterium sp. TaxID=2320850 RepID=UPI00355CCDD2